MSKSSISPSQGPPTPTQALTNPPGASLRIPKQGNCSNEHPPRPKPGQTTPFQLTPTPLFHMCAFCCVRHLGLLSSVQYKWNTTQRSNTLHYDKSNCSKSSKQCSNSPLHPQVASWKALPLSNGGSEKQHHLLIARIVIWKSSLSAISPAL